MLRHRCLGTATFAPPSAVRRGPRGLAIVALTACAGSAAPPERAAAGRAAPSPPCARPARFSPDIADLVLDGTLAGKPVRIGIDTGANASHVSSKLATSLPAVAGRRVMQNSAFDKPIVSAMHTVEGLELGGHRFAGFTASTGQDDHYDVMLGVSELERLRLDLDLVIGALCVLPGGPLDGGVPIERIAHGLLATPVTSKGRDAGRWMFDTGAGITVIAPKHVDALPHKARPAVDAVDATGAAQTMPTIELEELCVSGYCKASQPAMVLDLSKVFDGASEGVVGLPFMRGSRVVLDLSVNQWRLETPSSHASSASPASPPPP